MNTTLLRYSAWIGIIALIIAPLSLWYVDGNMFFPYITSKAFFWRFFIHIGVVAWIACALFSPKYRISWKHPLVLAMLVFMAVTLLANTLGNNPYISFWSSAERMDGYISLLYLSGWFIALVGLLRTRANIERMLMFLVGLGLVLAVYGWTQDKVRVDSKLGNPIYLASLSFFGIFLSAYFMVGKEKILGLPQAVRIGLCSILALAFLYTIFRTGTRGALLGLIGGGFTSAVLIGLLAREKTDRIWRGLALLVVATTLILGGLFFGARETLSDLEFVQNDVLLSRLVRISPEDRTTGFRLANWDMAIEGWKERPLLGWGQENYTEVFAKHYDVDALYNAEDWYDRVHNTFLDWLVFGGIIGLIAYCALFVVPLYLIWRRSPFDVLEKSVLTGLFVGYLFQNVVAFDSLASGIFLYLCFAHIYTVTLHGTPEEKQTKKKSVDEGNPAVAGLMLLVVILASGWWTYYSIYQPRESVKTYIDYIRATGPVPSGALAKEHFPLFEKIFKDDTFMERELTVHAMRQKDRFLTQGTEIGVAQNYLRLISTNTSEMMVRHNHPTSLYSFYGAFLLEIGRFEESLPVLAVAREKAPHKLKIILRHAQALEQTGNLAAADASYRYAIELAPQWTISTRIYEEFLKRSGGI